jgi:hypothetical protein
MPAPTEAFRICADTYLASIAPYLGPVVGIPRPLTQYRMHGRNWVMQFSEKQRSVEGRAMVRNYSAWFTIIIQTLRERLGVPTAVSLNDHYLYQIHRRNAGEAVPLWAVLFTIARCPLLPLTTKMKEALKVARNRR